METLLRKETDNFAADIWALGVVAIQTIIKKQHIFGSKSVWVFDDLDKIVKQQDPFLLLSL